MGRLIKTFPGGFVAIAHEFVHAPGYSLTVADYSVEGHVQDGWFYVADNLTDDSIAQSWAQPLGAQDAYELGAVVSHNGTRWRSTIIGNVWEPGVSGWADADTDVPTWIQPTGAHDAYSAGAMVKHNGDLWTSTLDANVWEPGVTGWRKAAIVPPDGGVPVPAWVQPLGAHDAYPLGARVLHNGLLWESTVEANVWEPGVFGWVEV